jgi:hypothetical protein
MRFGFDSDGKCYLSLKRAWLSRTYFECQCIRSRPVPYSNTHYKSASGTAAQSTTPYS